MNIFCVTSGLNSNFGLFDISTKLEQLIESATSIRNRVSDVYVILVDGGKYPITFNQRKLLLEQYDDIYDMSQHGFIQSVHAITNIPAIYVKNCCEPYCMQQVCEILDRQDATRIFKISGRYCLNDNFNIFDHTSHPGKYVFKKKDPGVRLYDPEKNIYFPFSEYQYQTRLYSFCSSLIKDAAHRFTTIRNNLVSVYSNDSFSIIEDQIYQVIPRDLIHEVDSIGLNGLKSENQEQVEE